MHELGVVLNMLDTLDAAAKRYGVSRIASVSVDVGEMTGIVPVYMHGVWPEAVNGTICAGSELYINMVKAIANCATAWLDRFDQDCADCGKDYEVMENARDDVPMCPFCGSTRWTLKQGDQLVIKEIEVAEE